MKRKDFAERIGVSPSYVTALCDGTVWPGRDVAKRIRDVTEGDVTADSFLDAGPGELKARREFADWAAKFKKRLEGRYHGDSTADIRADRDR